MPGNVAAAAPATVLPQMLARAFFRAAALPILNNEYLDGESQRSKLADTSRRSWRLAVRLAPAAMTALRAFYEARAGGHEAFYFYDPYDAAFAYDPTGAETTGRYTVRFDGAWSQAAGLGRMDAEIRLVEVA